jgi:hypothetical protein
MRTMVLLAMALLGGCGGGGGGGGSGVPPSVSLVSTTPPPVASPVAPVAAGDCSIGLYGDSILVNSNALVPRPIPTLLAADRNHWDVHDHAVAGSTATGNAGSFPSPQERFVVIEWGLNDFLDGYPDVTAPYAQMVALTQGAGKTPVLTGIVNTQPNDWPIAFEVSNFAATHKLAYADWPSVSGQSVDGVHPDEAMSQALAAKLENVIDSLAPECK